MSEVTYKLVVFARDVDINLGTMNPRHTGYALVKFENNEAVSMKTVEISGNILPPVMSLIQSETSDVALEGGWLPINKDLSSSEVFVPQQVYEGGEWINTTSEWVREREYVTKEINSEKITSPIQTYNKILLLADFFNELSQKGVSILYDPLGQNCNTWTAFVNNEYFNDVNVFSLFDDNGYVGSKSFFIFMRYDIAYKYMYSNLLEYSEIIVFKLLDSIKSYLDGMSQDFSEITLNVERRFSHIKCTIVSEDSCAEFVEDFLHFPSLNKIIDNLQASFSSAETTRSPLILDLDGNGVETVSVNDGVYFDHDGNGFAEKSGWASENDGILVRDLNNNGQIDGGNELFGDQTLLSDGTKAANGFEALAA